MSYMEPPLRFLSKKSESARFVPRPWIADGIRRSLEDKSIEPGARFITEEDYMQMMDASEQVALAMSAYHYRRGWNSGLGLAGAIVVGLLLLMALAGCSTAPKPVRPTGPVLMVSARVANVTAVQAQAYLWIKFTGGKKAWPVRVVDEQELEKMVPGTQALMVRVTDTASAGQEVRAPRPGEAALNVMIIP